ncbi:hypothetical protein KR074_003523, partial [Drosophila pseudoananassae]
MAQSAVDVALKKFIATSDRVSQFEANINTPAARETEVGSQYMCEVHRDQIRALWEKVEKSYESCSDLLAESDENAAISTVLESKYSYCYYVYSRCIAQLREKIASHTTPASVNVHTPASKGCRLPPVDTEVFAGDYLRWPTFRDLFTAIYIQNSRLTPVERLFHLLSKTSGDAHAIVSKAPLTHEGFASCLTALAMSSINVEAWDCLLVCMISSKLPKVTLSMWEQSVHNKAEIPTWKELDNFLTERHRTLEAIDDVRPSSSGQLSPRSGIPIAPARRLNSHETRVVPGQKGCDLCSREDHPICLCPRFLNMDVIGRSDYIRRKQLCLNCFGRGHQQRDCTSARTYFTCHSRHHTLLHRGNPFATAPNRISQFEANINTPGAPETEIGSQYMCEVPRDQIRALWEKVEKSYESCSDLLAVSDDKAAASTVLEAKYSNCYSVYSRCIAQ